jgi:hypothetical protein
MSTRIVVLSALALSLLACVRPHTREGFMQPDDGGITRAAFELSCPAEQLQVVDLGGQTMGVNGCGRRAIYSYVVTGSGYYFTGRWVNNTGVQTQPAPR